MGLVELLAVVIQSLCGCNALPAFGAALGLGWCDSAAHPPTLPPHPAAGGSKAGRELV